MTYQASNVKIQAPNVKIVVNIMRGADGTPNTKTAPNHQAKTANKCESLKGVSTYETKHKPPSGFSQETLTTQRGRQYTNGGTYARDFRQ